MSSRLLTCLFAATVLFTVGCDDSSGLDDDEAANVRIVNASPAVGELDVLVNDEVDTDGQVYLPGASSQCVRVDADDPTSPSSKRAGRCDSNADLRVRRRRRNTVSSPARRGNLRVVTLSDALPGPRRW